MSVQYAVVNSNIYWWVTINEKIDLLLYNFMSIIIVIMYTVVCLDKNKLSIEVKQSINKETTNWQRIKQTVRQTIRQSDIQIYRQSDGQINRQWDIQIYRQSEGQINRQWDIQIYRQSDTEQTDNQTKHKQTIRQSTNRQSDIQ